MRSEPERDLSLHERAQARQASVDAPPGGRLRAAEPFGDLDVRELLDHAELNRFAVRSSELDQGGGKRRAMFVGVRERLDPGA